MTDTVYSSQAELRNPGRFFSEAVRDLRRAPAVAWHLFLSNVRARHRRTWLGYVWLLLPTLATTAIWTYIQTRRVISIAPTAVPYPVYVLAGTVLWQVFVDALNAPLLQLSTSRQLITRSRVPHEALILAGVYEVLLNCAARLLVLAAALLLFAVPVGPRALLLPVGIAALMLLGLSLGMLIAPAGLLYDDVGRAVALATGFWFFLTPVIYRAPADGLLRLNPVTPLLETTRGWLTSTGTARGFGAVTFAALLTLFAAWLVQRIARPHTVARLG
jgi:lipopolysaccharide transport system permease protein